MFADEEARSKVKICGLTSLQDARFISGALAHYMGFIFYDESLRYIEPAKAGAIINWIEGPECVGVFVNQPLDDVNMIARQTGVDLVQLHGNESAEYCDLIEKPVIKVIHISNGTDASELEEKINSYRSHIDFLLFDTKIDGQWGGTGQSFEWNIINEISGSIPFFLSGGLNANNIREACRVVQPYAVDLSSGVESSPGIKSFDKIELFMDKMRDIWEEQEMR